MSRGAQYWNRERHVSIEAKPVRDLGLEYTSSLGAVTVGKDGRPMLIESMINQKNVALDVMEGYDPNLASVVNRHSIYHLYEFESQSKFLSSVPPLPPRSNYEEYKSKFLLCRYVICAIDDWMNLGKPIDLIAIRSNGDIYIGSNKVLDINENVSSKEAAFGGLNFAKKVTTGKGPLCFEQLHSVVKQLCILNHQKEKAMSLFVSSVVRAFDQKGEVVELKTVSSAVKGKLQNLSRTKARNWWLRALLSGAERIVYGLRMDDLKVDEIHEARFSEFTQGHFHFPGFKDRLFAEVYKLFEQIDDALPEEGSICQVRPNGGTSLIVEPTTSASLARSPFW